MAGNIQVPNNIEDKTVLKRFLTNLVLGINDNSLFSGNIEQQNAALLEIIQANPTMDFLNVVSKLKELRTDILTYVEENIETVILQNTEDIALVAEQFGTFYNQALAASWYGLSVKAGGAIAGLEVGSLDPDVITPGDESSYFRVIANNFILGRAYEDLTQEEKNYLTANNLPNFGTVYNAQKQPIPALVTTWDSANQVYKHYFNGIVNFTNISGTPVINKTYIQATAPSSGMVAGDTWLNTSASYASYNYNGSSWVSTGNKTYVQTTQPTFGCVAGDIWIDSDDSNRSYRYNGTSWIDTTINPAAIVNAGSTTINGGKITTSTLEANRLQPATGGTTVWYGGALVSQNFDGNSVGGIGSPTQGFRLSSDAAGTSSDPNIYGAYIKGGTIEGVNLSGISLAVNDIKVRAQSYPSNYGPLILSSNVVHSGGLGGPGNHTVTSKTFIACNNGSGYNANRMCPNYVTFTVTAYTVSGPSDIAYLTWIASLLVQYSTDNGSTWNTLYNVGHEKQDHAYSTTITLSTTGNIIFKAYSEYVSSNAISSLVLTVYAENYG